MGAKLLRLTGCLSSAVLLSVASLANAATCGGPCDATIQVTGESVLGFGTGYGTTTSWTYAPDLVNSPYAYITTSFVYGNHIYTTASPSISINNSTVGWTGTTAPSLTSAVSVPLSPAAAIAGSLNQNVFTYSFEVKGPPSETSDLVTIDVTAHGSVSAATGAGVAPYPGGYPDQGANAYAQLHIAGPIGGSINDVVQACYGIANGGSASCSSTQGTGEITSSTISAQGFSASLVTGIFQETATPLEVGINDVYTVILNEYLNCSASSGGANCSASIDPFITLAPGSPGTVSLVFSPNLSPTPLPATLPLLMTGLGLMGAFGWCRKRKAGLALAA